MKVPTAKKIAAEIKALKALMPLVRERDFFGGNNRTKMAAQIYVLEHELTEAECYDRYDDDQDLCSNAVDAALWLQGKSESASLVEEWKSLARRTP